MNESQAVSLCQQGDKEAFRVIVEAYGDLLFGIAMMMTRDRMMAEDAVQDALVQAWNAFNRFQPGTNLRAWLTTILVNRVRSLYRRRRPEDSGPREPLEEPWSSYNSLDAVINAQEAEHIRAALARLEFEPRQAVVLRFYAEMSIPEIAAALGWKEGTVKSRLHRALKQLEEILLPARPRVAALQTGEDLRK